MIDQPLGHVNRTLWWHCPPLMALGVVAPPLKLFGGQFSVRAAGHPCCELNQYLLTLSDCINYPSIWNCWSKSISPSQDLLCMCSLLCIHFLQVKVSEEVGHLSRVFCMLASPRVKSYNFSFFFWPVSEFSIGHIVGCFYRMLSSIFWVKNISDI